MDAAGTTRYTYTAAGQLLTEDGPLTSDTVTNIYSNRRRVGLSLPQPTGLWTNGFDWDAAGRLTNVTSPAGSFGYAYTDCWRVIQERTSVNTPTVSYTRGLDLSGSLEGAGGIGGLLARSSGYSAGNWTSHAFYHADGNGNITCLINTNQSVVASYRYDPFGNTISQSGSLADANIYRFSSKEIHTNSLMYYFGYRFYVPNLERWLNRDPIGELGGLNLYRFAGNQPTSYVDAYGLDTDWSWWYRLLLLLWSLGHPYDPPKNPPSPPKGPPPIVRPVPPLCPNTNAPPNPIIYYPLPINTTVNTPPWIPSPGLPKPAPILIFTATGVIIIIIFFPKPAPA